MPTFTAKKVTRGTPTIGIEALVAKHLRVHFMTSGMRLSRMRADAPSRHIVSLGLRGIKWVELAFSDVNIARARKRTRRSVVTRPEGKV